MLLDLHENIIVNSNWIFLVKDPYKLIFYFQTPASMELLKLVKNTEIFNSFYASKISLKFPKSLFMVAVEFLEFRIPFFRQSLFSKRDRKTRIIFFLLILGIFSTQLHRETTIYCFGNSFKKVFSYRLFFWGQKNFRNGSVWWF